ncbi:hypothetical protein [Azospirillum soli]|uniref:hypothetical protein n=1 Tax=Azospirillum soli TaxID=1304799 RepID=UPI001AE8373F|nr:hypothetical protein [Azospirillum soli]MBP2316317.1 hypothetical protein [Azospirillum soli]
MVRSLSRPLRLAVLAAVATASASAAGPSLADTSWTSRIRSPYASMTPQTKLCVWVTYTTPYLYKKNTCTGETQILLR